MNIINIGTPITHLPDYQIHQTDIFSNLTLLDADIIFWDVNSSHNKFPGSYGTINRDVRPRTIENLKQQIQKRKKEFNEFFKIGRTLILTNPIFHRYEYSMSGSDEVLSLDFIDCLEIEKPKYELVQGQNIQSVDNKAINYFCHTNTNILRYSLKILDPKGIPLMFIKDTKYVVSELFRINNGLLILLPNFTFSNRKETEVRQFVQLIIDFIPKLHEYATPVSNNIPEWVDKYLVSGENNEINNLEKLNKKLNEIKLDIQKSEDSLNRFNFLKGLFSAEGNTLENVIDYVFKDIGFNVERPEGNRDDLIIKIDNKVAVVEIKGLTKSAAEKHAAQLQKWVSNYHAENEYNPKGILIANTYRDKMLEDRNSEDFPNQMLRYVEQMNHCLLTGIQLLCLYLDFKSKKIKKEQVVSLLFDTTGILIYQENPLSIIKLK